MSNNNDMRSGTSGSMDTGIRTQQYDCPTIQSSVEAVRRYLESMPQNIPFKEEVKSYSFWKAVRCEFLATMLLVILGCGASLNSAPVVSNSKGTIAVKSNGCDFKVTPIEDLVTSLSFGFVYTIMTECIGGVSGAHMNPAVTIAMLIARYISPLKASVYILAQCTASVAACGILYGLTPKHLLYEHSNSWITIPQCGINTSQAFGVEFLATFSVILVFLSVVEDNRPNLGCCSLYVGISYCLGNMFAIKYTGASLNPARSLGPAIVSNTWNQHWVYWVGPILGALLASFTYEYTKDNSENRRCRYDYQQASTSRDRLTRTQSGISAIEETVLSNECRA